MNIRADQLDSSLLIAGFAGMAVILAWASKHAAWRDERHLGSSFGAAALISVIWQLSTGIKPGLSFHLLGMSALVLIAGLPRAVIGLALILCANAANQHGDFAAIGINFCAMLPALGWAWACLRLSQRYLPTHYFSYFFANGFFGAAAGFWLAALGHMLTLWAAGVYSATYLSEEALPYYLLFGWSEAFTTGIVMAVLVIYFPQWVRTFDDGVYLQHGSQEH
ncbi:energy-coupling factor ABC transporter permease [Burkholderiaceae bacterium DAT-1]|nr:energy-coupling factor ABC transporter permease [Burkholderiaceae bacterium DAT-1]